MSFIPITRKVNAVILAALILGIGSVSFYLTASLFTTIEEGRQESLVRESEIVYEAIEQLMVPGEAPLVVNYFEGLRTVDSAFNVALYRTDGSPAFSDNQTIQEVNNNISSRMFEQIGERDEGVTPQMDLPPIDENRFSEATAIPPVDVLYQTREQDTYYARIHRSLINLPKCAVCHGSDHTIRGVIDIRTEVTDSVARQQRSVVTASGFFLGLVLVAGIVLSAFLRRMVINPVQQIGSVCEAVTDGDFEQHVALPQNDEIGRLGNTVNTMVQGLKERFHLSRYVSSSTLKSIQTEATGGTVTVTMFFADIRGFTAFSESNPPDQVVSTLNAFINLETKMIVEEGGDVDKYVGDEVVAIFSGDDASLRACRAATRIQRAIAEAPPVDAGTELKVGIGVHHGNVIMGAVGSEDRADFTVIGDDVNTASRLCSAAGEGETIVSEVVQAAVVETFETDGPFRLVVKGKSGALRVYKLLEPKNNDVSIEDRGDE